MATEVSKTCPDCAPDRLVVRTNGDNKALTFWGA